MTCDNCGKETFRKFFEKIEENGILKTLTYCPLCPKVESPSQNFPRIITKKRNKRSSDDVKFKQYELSPEEISQTQKLRTNIRVRDPLISRQLSDVDRFSRKELVKVFVGSYGGVRREKKVHDEIVKKCGTDNFSIRSDDGFKVIAEVGCK